jgi:YbgC/YbaW family acyl-CoA thioester hydrolase
MTAPAGHHMRLQVRWSDLDPYGHVNHAAYLTFLEQARIAALEDIGWGMAAIAAAGFRVVVARAELTYRRPAVAGDELEIASAILELRPASSVWRQEVGRRGEVLVEARVTGACTDLEGRPRRVPAAFQEALRRLQPG